MLKPLCLKVHVAMRRKSGNMEPYKISDGIFVGRWSVCTINNGNLSLLSKSVYKKRPSSVLITRSKNKA